jgi:hypothetical protein
VTSNEDTRAKLPTWPGADVLAHRVLVLRTAGVVSEEARLENVLRQAFELSDVERLHAGQYPSL